MLTQLLKQFDETTDPRVLRALVYSIQALPAKLTEPQAEQALAPVLHQIGQSTDADALQVLAQAFQALAGKLTEAQAQRALVPVLRQFRRRPIPTYSGRWLKQFRRWRLS